MKASRNTAFKVIYIVAALLCYSTYSYNLIQEKAAMSEVVEGKSTSTFSEPDNGVKCLNDEPTFPTADRSASYALVTSMTKQCEESPIDLHLKPLILPPIGIC